MMSLFSTDPAVQQKLERLQGQGEMTEVRAWRFTVILCVTAVCLTTIIVAMFNRPGRYRYHTVSRGGSRPSVVVRVDTKTGEAIHVYP